MNVTTITTQPQQQQQMQQQQTIITTIEDENDKMDGMDDDIMSHDSDDDDDDMSGLDDQYEDGQTLMNIAMKNEVTSQLIAAGVVGVAAAAAITSSKKKKRPHSFETNPSIRKRQQNRLLRKLRVGGRLLFIAKRCCLKVLCFFLLANNL
jgi:NLS-binding and DNA-binding and dimerisation domains of Nrf1